MTSFLQPNLITHAAEKSGYEFEDRKYTQHENSYALQGFLFIPLAIEVLFGLSSTLKKALLRMSLLADSRKYQLVVHSTVSIEQFSHFLLSLYEGLLLCCCRSRAP